MRAKTFFLMGLFASSMLLSGCGDVSKTPQPLPISLSDLPPAPVQPSYVRLSPTEPPALEAEIEPTNDDLQHKTWKPGYWSYDSGQFSWVAGEMISKPAFTAVWVPDHWEKREYGWAFVPGFWQ